MEKEEVLVNYLIKNKYHITFAESLTAGMLAAKLVNVANASMVLNESFVTYSNEAKMKYLNVKEETIEKYTVVSEEVAKEMAIGAAKASNSDIAVTTTGVAGPSGGTEKTPVGMVCFGFYINGKVITKTKYFSNIGRNLVRIAATEYAFDEIIELLK